MRFTLWGFIFLIVFIVITDLLLIKYWKDQEKEGELTSGFRRAVGYFLYIALPAFFSCAFLYIYLSILEISDGIAYYWISMVIGVFFLLYLPKFVFVFVWYMGVLVYRFRSHREANHHIDGEMRYPRISRKKFLSQVGIILASAPFLSLLFGMAKGRFNFSTKYQKLSFPNLPLAFDGMKIVQISDLHLGSFYSSKEKLEEAVRIINSESPDIICFTGDLVNNFYEETIGWEKVLGKLTARLGKYSILGNHDYGDYTNWKTPQEKERNFQGIVDSHERFGFRLLRNESVALSFSGEEIVISGVENWGHPPFPRYGNLSEAREGTEDFPFKVLLTHDPDHWEEEVIGKTKYDLTLAGHTHGMQFGIEWKNFQWSPAQYKFKRWAGLYRQEDQFLYVNRGLGILGLPARVGMPPEISVVELVRGPVTTEPM